MSLETDVRCLAGVGPLAALPREALQMLAFSCQKRRLSAGEALFAAGDPADGAFVVLAGEITLRRAEAARQVGAGALIGEMALLAETERSADAAAARDSELMLIPRETFRRVLTEFPASAEAIARDLAARTQATMARLDAIRRRDFGE